MTELLADQTAVVTGASSGIGRAIAGAFGSEGADVIVADIREQPRRDGEPTHEMIESTSDARAKYIDADVTDASDIEAAVDAADEFGGIDIMVNNAGVLGPNGPITEISYQEYRELLDINLDGVFLGAKVAAERLIEQGDGGAIVNISSLAGLQGHANIIPYTTAKAGVRNMTYALAEELGTHGIRVNAIHPGEVETALTTEDMPIIGTEDGEAAKQNIPLGKYAQPEDVANAATFLASEMASHITAESLVVDGGVFNTA